MRSNFHCPHCKIKLRNVLLPVRHKCIMGNPKLPVYFTTAMLAEDTLRMCGPMPPIRIVVGIARSGMIPASIIATHLGAELWTINNETGEINQLGRGRRFVDKTIAGKVLLVDDSVYSGYAMSKAAPVVERFYGEKPLLAGVYCKASGARKVDFYGRITETHWFQWNLFNAPYIGKVCFDHDGVLNRDFHAYEDDDGPRYLEAMENMLPTHNRPRCPINIVTARLEKYREPTLAWLDKHCIPVKNLIMGPWDTLQDRNEAYAKGDVWRWKADAMKQLDCTLFVESCKHGAQMIAKHSGRHTIATDTNEVFYG